MLAHSFCAAVNGLVATIIEIEVDSFPGCRIYLSGLPDTAIRESLSRVRSAIIHTGYNYPQKSITLNFAPAHIKKEGTGYDLSIAIGLLATFEVVNLEKMKRTLLVGELGLDGTLRPVRGCLPIAIEARKNKFKSLIVPIENVREAAVVNNLNVYGAHHLAEVIDFMNGKPVLEPTIIDARKEFYDHQSGYDVDFSEVRGQESVKRAFEVAAAGGHNIILIGSPGCGKSMMAKRLPTILPPLTLSESLETTQIHSVAGILPSEVSLLTQRPFRSPHHTISDVALIGGGTSFQPGEISLANHGVLFLDELPEFSKQVLETMRQPLEDHKISISRAKYNVELPCSFMLVAAMNPCPCGYYGDSNHRCVCSPGQIQRYLSRISGPLLDRIDIHCEIQAVPFAQLSQMQPGEPSSAIRERVIKARQIQEVRFKNYKGVYCNAQMTERMLHQFAEPDNASLGMLRMAMERLKLSARAYSRILKVARTIADLAGSERVESVHIAEAINYRNLDRGDWAERGI